MTILCRHLMPLFVWLEMGIKRTPLDAVFSDLVRERADWTCEVCDKHFPDRKGSGLHASHYWGRRGKSTRWYGLNVFAHCFGCHQKLGSKPHEFKSWVFKQLGETLYDQLTLRANAPMKYSKQDLKDMQAHFKKELAEIRQKRKDGWVGYIDFVEYD